MAVKPSFAARVVRWQAREGRHDLPWQNTRDAYRIWLSEIMLQQTQVAAVIPYFARFLAAFPTLKALATAPSDAVMQQWAGLGYYARARNLHRAAQQIAQQHGGKFPADFDSILALPGVGRSTAGAIAVFAFDQRFPILDGNVRRVFARHFGVVGDTTNLATVDTLWSLAERELPAQNVRAYIQGLMDLGATVCTRSTPACDRCPVAKSCVALREDRVAELPCQRVKKVSPKREIQMLLILSQGDVLLQKRPAPGIWGGLWSLPELAIGADVASAVQAQFQLRPTKLTVLPLLQHGFTHFTLTISPMVVQVARGIRQQSKTLPQAFMWVELNDAIDAAIPAPVKRILQAFQEANKR